MFTKAERMRACLAEAGFVEGRDFKHLGSCMNDGYAIWFSHEQDTPALKAAIEKASQLSGPVYPSEPYVPGTYSTASNP